MLSSIFTKTLYEKRWGLLWWSVAMAAFTVMIVLAFPIFQDAFGEQMDAIPESLRSIVGEANDYQRVEGYLELQVFMQMVFLTFIYGIILFTGLLAGEENDGTLQSLLAQPISRTKVYLQKLAAGATLLGILSIVMLLSTWAGLAIIDEGTSAIRLLGATFAQWLVGMVFALLAYMIGAVSGRKGIAGALAGVYAFLGYIVTSLAATVTVLEYPNYLSPFRYFNNTKMLDQGLQAGNIAVLLLACLVFSIVGWLVFRNRDIQQ